MGIPQLTFFDGGDYEIKKDNKYPKPTRDQIREHMKRLENGKTMTLYHQTSSDVAKLIVSSQEMLRGSTGLAGGGIYFATTPRHTNHKTLHQGPILECTVKLGNIYKTSFSGDSTLSFRKLINMTPAFDSVIIPRTNREEYVIYNKKQIVSIKYYNPPSKTNGVFSWISSWFW